MYLHVGNNNNNELIIRSTPCNSLMNRIGVYSTILNVKYVRTPNKKPQLCYSFLVGMFIGFSCEPA